MLLFFALRRHQTETAAALDALLPAVLERAFRGGALDHNRNQFIINPLESFYKLPTS
ncbi:MAG: hypothetical protein GX463_05870 [Methanothrix sp.]|nr:hypothetical protein [Methanothrix sp.]HNQ55676.1 hypothetical protein [Methanothrix sp.]